MSTLILPDTELASLTSIASSPVKKGLSYGTVRDLAQGADLFPRLLSYNGDIKDSQRYWTLKAIISTQPVGARLLEIGAGEPLVADILGRLGYKVFVVDPYEGAGNGPTNLEHFRSIYKNVEYIQDYFSTTTQGIPPSSIDCCYSISVIEHIPIMDLRDIASAIGYFTVSGGSSIHAIDVVSLGAGDEYHKKMFVKFSEYLGYDPFEAIEALDAAARDPDTYYLSAEAHNRWRGAIPYDEFPMRRVQSMKVVGFGSEASVAIDRRSDLR